jgi:hypothetical protein
VTDGKVKALAAVTGVCVPLCTGTVLIPGTVNTAPESAWRLPA